MKLVKGKGSPTRGACLMSAIAWYVGEQNWTDTPKCVCPIIRSLGIWANDALESDEDRERVLGPIMFSLIGTANPALLLPRKIRIVRFAAEKARSVLHLAPVGEDRTRLAIEAAEKWCEDPSEENSAAAAAYSSAADAYASAYASASAVYASASAAADAAAAAYSSAADAYAYASAAYASAADAASAASAASAAASAAAYASACWKNERANVAEYEIVPLILELAEMGERNELPQVRRLEDIPAYSKERGGHRCRVN